MTKANNDQNPIVNLILNGETSDLIPLTFQVRNYEGCPLKLILCFHPTLEILASIQLRSTRTDIKITKKNAKLSLCVNDITV